MCAPIPQNKWSWKFDKCVVCETRTKIGKFKHKGNGLCVSCFDKERAKNPNRKQQLKNQHDKWYLSVKGTEEYKEYSRVNVAKWNKKQPLKHRRNWQKRNLKMGIKKFLLSTAQNRTQKGLTINLDDKIIKTNIKPPKQTIVGTESDDTTYKMILFKKIYRELKAKQILF